MRGTPKAARAAAAAAARLRFAAKNRKGQVWDADPWTQRAKQQGYLARSAFKLLEAQAKHRLIPRGGAVLDLGCAPGAWLEAACQTLGRRGGRVVGVDLQEVAVPERFCDAERVAVLKADAQDVAPEVLAELAGTRDGRFDAVISDMSPATSGAVARDVALSLRCAEAALGLTAPLLRPGGSFMAKLLQGAGVEEYMAAVKQRFLKAAVFHPKATRKGSREVSIVGKGFSVH